LFSGWFDRLATATPTDVVYFWPYFPDPQHDTAFSSARECRETVFRTQRRDFGKYSPPTRTAFAKYPATPAGAFSIPPERNPTN
jgi:hypothetical protein